MLGAVLPQLALNGDEQVKAREVMLVALPITFILAFCAGMFGLFPGTKPILSILVRTFSDGQIGSAIARAERVKKNVFWILPLDKVFDVTNWEFRPGERVRCERGRLSNGQHGLIAVERID